MLCPNCHFDNIPGVDLCENCGSDLAGLDIPEAAAGLSGRLLSDRVGELPLAPAISVKPAASVADAVQLMRRERQGFVLVVDNESLVGIFTERDVLGRVLRAGLAPADTSVQQVMTPGPTTLQPDDPPAFAVHRMVSQKFRHVPIADGDRVQGLLSIRGVLQYLQEDLLGG